MNYPVCLLNVHEAIWEAKGWVYLEDPQEALVWYTKHLMDEQSATSVVIILPVGDDEKGPHIAFIPNSRVIVHGMGGITNGWMSKNQMFELIRDVNHPVSKLLLRAIDGDVLPKVHAEADVVVA